MFKAIFIGAAFGALSWSPACFADQQLDTDIAGLARAWDHAQFEVADKTAKVSALQAVESSAKKLAAQYPSNAGPLVWEAIALSSEAGAAGGLDALGKVTKARDLLESAQKIDASALGDGSIYTSLGSLYASVPGFPIGFGNRDRARRYLERAVAVNPNGIDSNYFMADFLVRQHDYANAEKSLQKASAAPPRLGREVADRGRRRDIEALMTQVRAHLQR